MELFKYPSPVIDNGERGSYDEGYMGEPVVIASPDAYEMWYEAIRYPPYDARHHWTIAYASSTDGVRWNQGPGEAVSTEPRLTMVRDHGPGALVLLPSLPIHQSVCASVLHTPSPKVVTDPRREPAASKQFVQVIRNFLRDSLQSCHIRMASETTSPNCLRKIERPDPQAQFGIRLHRYREV